MSAPTVPSTSKRFIPQLPPLMCPKMAGRKIAGTVRFVRFDGRPRRRSPGTIRR
jgi:hypothetical protein